jgi:hypothetical protein
MKRWTGFVAVAALVVALVASPAFAGEVTVGKFLIEIAKVRSLAASDAATAERALRSAGVQLPDLDLRKTLTEGDVAEISKTMGLRVSSARPESVVSQNQVDSFVQTFGSDLTAGPRDPGYQPNTPPRDDPNPGKGNSKGFYKSPTEPI